MGIGKRLRQLREQKGLSQGDIEKATGLLRCYTSRVENGHTIPSLETLERFAVGLDVPLYQFFYTGDEPIAALNSPRLKTLEELAELNDKEGLEARFLLKLKKLLEHMVEPDREVLLTLARKLAAR